MQNSGTSTSPAGAAVQMAPVTTTSLIVIALAIVVTILMIWWGARALRARRDAVETLEDSGRVERTADDTPPAADVPGVARDDPGAVALASPAGVEAMPIAAPTAPSPPPIADAPTVATAPSAIVAPPSPQVDHGNDDLTSLKGIGPKVAAELAQRGITSFATLAALSPAQAEALDAELGNFRGRMFRDRWVDQARYLADGDRAGFEAEFGKL